MTADQAWHQQSSQGWIDAVTEFVSIDEEGNDLVVRVRGDCPRCRHPMGSVYRRGLVLKAAADTPEPVVFTVYCTCPEPHDGRPDGRVGCGSYGDLIID